MTARRDLDRRPAGKPVVVSTVGPAKTIAVVSTVGPAKTIAVVSTAGRTGAS